MARKIAILFILATGFNFLVLSIVWVHYEFVWGLNPFPGFLLLLFLVPLCIFGGRHLTRYLRHNNLLSPAWFFVWGAIILASAYLIDEPLFGHSLLEPRRSHSYFGTAHLYTRLLFVLLFIVLAGAYRFFPVISHRALNPTLGYIHFGITLVCAYLLIYPIHYEALAGMPRRYLAYAPPPQFHPYTLTDKLEFILLAAQSLFLINLLNSTRRIHEL